MRRMLARQLEEKKSRKQTEAEVEKARVAKFEDSLTVIEKKESDFKKSTIAKVRQQDYKP